MVGGIIKAVLFDLDNTLVDFKKVKAMTIESAVSAMINAGLKTPKKKIMHTLDRIYKEQGVEYQHVFDDLLTDLEGRINPKILAAGVVAYRKVKNAYLDPYPGVAPTLMELVKRGYRLGIISDATRLQVWTRLCDMHLENFFEFVICFEDSGARKPSLLPFKEAINKLKLKPHEVVMVGDMLERDIVGAQRLGIKTVLAKYGTKSLHPVGLLARHIPKGVKPDYSINNITDLLLILG